MVMTETEWNRELLYDEAYQLAIILHFNNTVTVKTTAGDKVFNNTITFGQDSKATIAGLEYTVNVTESANGYTGTMTLGGKKGTASTEKTADGFTQTVTIDGVTAKRHFKKC